MNVSTRYLLEGAWYALEQCGHLVADAAILYDQKRYGTAASAAMFAHEELGKARILMRLREEVAAGKRDVPLSEVQNLCDDHNTKQRAGVVTIVQRFQTSSRLAMLIRGRQAAKPGSPEFAAADDEITAADQALRKHLPKARHQVRLRALYVDPDPSGAGWTRPTTFPASEALQYITDAGNDYALQWDRFEHGHVDEDLLDQLNAWPERPPLPVPRRPRVLEEIPVSGSGETPPSG